MPQLSKGGKWVFGWCFVDTVGNLRFPEEAFLEYCFETGESVAFLQGSHSSGGFSVARLEKLAGGGGLLLRRSLGYGVILEGRQVAVPPQVNLQPGERLLAVRGSRYALLFVQYGSIYETAREKLA